MKRDLQKVIAHVDTFLKQKMAAARTPALTIALLDREQTLYVGTYGYANLETRTPLTPQHLFEIGSVGKVFTAVAILQLHEQGQLDLHAPVTDYLPWFAVNNPFAQPITLHHLLRNTSGLGAGLDFSPDGRGEVWELRQTTLGFAPGSQVHYSNVGYKVLGLVLEAVTQRPYPDIIERQILQPLGMTQSVAQITHDTRARLGRLRLPCLIVRPGRDRLVQPSRSDDLARLIPFSSLVRLDDAGHGVTFQSAEALNAMLLSHFAAAEGQLAGPDASTVWN